MPEVKSKPKAGAPKPAEVQPFRMPDATNRYGSPEAQAQMDLFLQSLNDEQKSTLQNLFKVMQSGPCIKDGYKKTLRYIFGWFQNHGSRITVDL